MHDLEMAARAIFFETLKAVDIAAMIRQRIRLDADLLLIDERVYDLSRFTDVILIGIGKASLQMGHALESILGPRLSRGLLVTNRREPLPLKSEIIVARHPVPDAESLRAGKRAIEVLRTCRSDSLVVFLISGGGSSLFEVPVTDEITLEDLRQLNRILVECGATIDEINVVRKQFSAVKGGKLKKWMKGGEAIAILVSDVNTGDFKSLASNLLFPEASTYERFQAILEKYKLAAKLPHLPQPGNEDIEERREPGVEICLLAENVHVINAAGKIARDLGYSVWVDRADNEDSYDLTVTRLISALAELKRANPDQRICILSGGEVSCPVKGPGFGGRNQEFALHCAMKLRAASFDESLVLSCGTDGIDGRSIAVGATARTGQMIGFRADDSELQHYFQASDTTSWFHEAGGLIVTGPTGNNLRDLRVILSN
jgi:glycerate 2-kinase